MKMNDLEQKPRLRFKGFTEAWEQRKYAELGVPLSGGSLSYDSLDDENGQYNCVLYGDLYTNYDCVIKDIVHKTNLKGNSIIKNDILFPQSTTVDAYSLISPACLNENNAETSGVFVIRPNEDVDGIFVCYYTKGKSSQRIKLSKKAQGLTIVHLYYHSIKDETLYMPKILEQKKISSLFINLDNLITLHQRKCEKLKSFKTALLEKMFPGENEATPKIRFKGFTEAWEQRNAKELCSITTGKSNTQDQVDDGKYPFYIRSDVPVKSNKFLFDEEAVITIGDGNIGKVFHYVNGKFDLHQRCYKMADFSYVSAKFFYWYFSTKFYKRAMSMTAKATVDSVRLEMISDMSINYPENKDEQSKISAFLFQLDSLITLHQRKCEKLKNLKKSLLERMFI